MQRGRSALCPSTHTLPRGIIRQWFRVRACNERTAAALSDYKTSSSRASCRWSRVMAPACGSGQPVLLPWAGLVPSKFTQLLVLVFKYEYEYVRVRTSTSSGMYEYGTSVLYKYHYGRKYKERLDLIMITQRVLTFPNRLAHNPRKYRIKTGCDRC